MNFGEEKIINILNDNPMFIVNVSKLTKRIVETMEPYFRADHQTKSRRTLFQMIQTQTSIDKNRDYPSLLYKKNPYKKIQKNAIKQTIHNCLYLNKIHPSVQMYAVKADYRSFGYIQNPCPEVVKYVEKIIKKNSNLDHATREERIEILKVDPIQIFFIKHPTLEEQKLLIDTDVSLIGFIANLDPSIQLAAMKKKCDVFCMFKNPCEEAKMMFIKKRPSWLTRIKNPSREIQYESVSRCGAMIKFADQKCPVLRMTALAECRGSIIFLKNPLPEEEIYVYSEGLHFSHIRNPSVEFIMYVLDIYPELIEFIQKPTPEMIEKVIKIDPECALFIGGYENPSLQTAKYNSYVAPSNNSREYRSMRINSDTSSTGSYEY